MTPFVDKLSASFPKRSSCECPYCGKAYTAATQGQPA